MAEKLNAALLANESFWKGKPVRLPKFDRASTPVRFVSFSAGNMAQGLLAQTVADLIEAGVANTGMISGFKTHGQDSTAGLAESAYLTPHLVLGEDAGDVTLEIRGAFKDLSFLDSSLEGPGWRRLFACATDPNVLTAVINAPEPAWGISSSADVTILPVTDEVQNDIKNGTVTSNLGKWTWFAYQKFLVNLPVVMWSMTNWANKGLVTRRSLLLMADGWVKAGKADPKFLEYLSSHTQPVRLYAPDGMIDRIAVGKGDYDERIYDMMKRFDLDAVPVVTEQTRWIVVEDDLPVGYPDIAKADGVYVVSGKEVAKWEFMKLWTVNTPHSTAAGLGVLLGFGKTYGVCAGMHDQDLGGLVKHNLALATRVLDAPSAMDAKTFADNAWRRLCNQNLPDNPMRIATGSTDKMSPRFTQLYQQARKKGVTPQELRRVLAPIAGFLRYTLGTDDQGNRYELMKDKMLSELTRIGQSAKLGDPSSAQVFRPLIADPGVMGVDLYTLDSAGKEVEAMVGRMLEGPGAVRRFMQELTAAA